MVKMERKDLICVKTLFTGHDFRKPGDFLYQILEEKYGLLITFGNYNLDPPSLVSAIDPTRLGQMLGPYCSPKESNGHSFNLRVTFEKPCDIYYTCGPDLNPEVYRLFELNEVEKLQFWSGFHKEIKAQSAETLSAQL